MMQFSLWQLLVATLLLSNWFTEEQGVVALVSPMTALARQRHNSYLGSLRFAPDETSENVEEGDSEDDDVEFMATYVINRLGRVLLQKKMKQLQELKDQKIQNESVDETETEIQPEAAEESKSLEKAESFADTTENKIDSATNVKSVEEADSANENPLETEEGEIITSSSVSAQTSEEATSEEDQSKLDEITTPESIPEPAMTMAWDSITVIPDIPPQISLDFGRELEVAKERIPPLQKPVNT